jgi:hypothetical protein
MTIQLELINGKITDPDGIDPDADLDYELDLTDWLAGIADTLAAMPGGLTVSSVLCSTHNPSINGAKIKVWVTDADAASIGQKASWTYHITTVGGRQEDWTIYAKIKQK